MRARMILVLLLGILSGCSSKPHGPTIRPGEPEPIVEPGLSDAECRELAEKFAKAVQDKDLKSLRALVDWDVILENATADVEATKKEKDHFLADMKGQGEKAGIIATEILDALSGGAEFKYLHAHVVGNKQRLLFRISSPEAAGIKPESTDLRIDYHDVVLSRGRDGQVRASDIYVLTKGEMLSLAARRAFVISRLRILQPPGETLQPLERAYLLHFREVEQMTELARQGKHEQVLAVYDRLPSELQKEKPVLLVRLRSAQALGGAAYSEAVENFRAFVPNDPCIDLYAIPVFRDKKDFPRALEAIDRLEETVGDPAYANFLRADVYLAKNDLPAAQRAAEAAVSADAALARAHWLLLDISLREKNHAETLKRLLEIERRFAPKLADLATIPECADFVKSPQYQEWLKSHGKP